MVFQNALVPSLPASVTFLNPQPLVPCGFSCLLPAQWKMRGRTQFADIMTRVMPHRTPEQSVYLHLFSASDGLITRMRYADLVRQCHLSLSAVQRASQRCRYRKPLG